METCPECQNPFTSGEDGDWCEKCNKLFYQCNSCDEFCDFLGIIGDPDYCNRFWPFLLLKDLAPLKDEDYPFCGLFLGNDMNYYVSAKTSKSFDVPQPLGLDDCCAYQWECKKCSLTLWSNPD